jgi:hypothetical protein
MFFAVFVAVLLNACQPGSTATPVPPTVTLRPSDTSVPKSVSKISLVDSGQTIGSGPANSIALGDVDNDGDLDAFVAYGQWDQPAPNKVFLNDGQGHFVDSGQELGMKKSFGVGLGDFDRDGDLDAFVSNGDYYTGDENEIWFNRGDGQFELKQSIGKTNGMVLVGDLNGDGYLDAFLCNHILSDGSNGGHRVYLNDGTGRFTDSGQILGGNQEGRKGVLGDIDGDGDLDAVVGSYATGTEVWINDGTGHFMKDAQILGFQETREVALGDLDGNGSLDVFLARFKFPNQIWLNIANEGKTLFEITAQGDGGTKNSGVKLGDLDGDGDLDAFIVVSVYEETMPNRVMENDGHGNFADSGLRLGNDESQDVALGDLDGDGRLDAFVVNRTTPGRIYFNGSNTGAVLLPMSTRLDETV